MNLELGGLPLPEETPGRTKLIEEVYRKFHKDLIRWCKYKLMKMGQSLNMTTTVEDLLAELYDRLLSNKTPIDLNRSEGEVRQYLNIAMENVIYNYFKKGSGKNRMPRGGLVSLEELQESVEDEEELPKEIKRHLIKDEDSFTEISTPQLQNALAELEVKDKRLADILRKRYLEDKTLQQIADEQGLTKQWIEQLEKKGLKILRGMIVFPRQSE